MLRHDNRDVLLVMLAGASVLLAIRLALHPWWAAATAADPYGRRIIRGHVLPASKRHLMGAPQSAVVIEEFADFECSYCREFEPTLRALVARDSGSVAVEFRHFPLPMHPRAYAAAIASECADMQGRFQQYASLLFANQDRLGQVSWDSLAFEAGATDTVRFNACLRGSTARSRVNADISAGRALALTGTPAIVVGRRLAVGLMPLDTLERFIELASRQ